MCHDLSLNTQQRDTFVLWLSQDALSSLFLYRWMALASLKSLGTEPLTQNCCINSVSLTVMTSPPSLKIFGGISSATGAFPAWSCLFFSGFPSVLGDRQESLEPGAEAYLGWLTGRSVEKLAKDFTPTLNDIRLPCKHGSIRRWDRSHGIEKVPYTVFKPSKNLLKLCTSEYCSSSAALCCHHLSFICLSSV